MYTNRIPWSEVEKAKQTFRQGLFSFLRAHDKSAISMRKTGVAIQLQDLFLSSFNISLFNIAQDCLHNESCAIQ